MRIVSPEPPSFKNYWSEIYKFRHLITTMGVRELKNRYSQSVMGVALSFFQALVGLIVISFVFGKLLGIESAGLPYPVFAFPGILAWNCFNTLLGSSGNALIESRDLIKKIYFPKMILPFTKVFTVMVEMAIGLLLLTGLLFFYEIVPSWRVIFFPFFIILNIITGLSVGLWVSALTYRKRDLGFIIPYFMSFLILVTPIFYPNSIIPVEYDLIKYCNPLTCIVVGFRWSLYGIDELSWQYCLGYIPVIFLLISVFRYYRRIEGKLADIL